MSEILSKKEFKDSEREKKEKEKKTMERKRKSKKLAKRFFILAIILAVGWGIWRWAKTSDKNLPGVEIPQLGRNHINLKDQHEPYNSNPPTSGPHYGTPAQADFYEAMLPDEQVLHNLEHGYVWISYKDDTDKDLMEKLKNLQKKYSWKTIFTFRPQNDSKIALVSWGRLQKLDNYDEKAIINFIKQLRNRGPEATPI
ncbi:MAG: DUF3105 domain-containing protein [Parcubacteria group bacterium]|nr:DUF3105 domain-containing protein [Parcubacteria group bacterium]